MEYARRIGRVVDSASEISGHIAKWMVPVLILEISYDTLARYLFNAPTIWSYDVSYMLGASLIVLAAPYVYLHRSEIRIDIVYSRLPVEARRVLDLVLTVLLTLPFCVVSVIVFASDARHAYLIGEFADDTVWYPELWPVKTVVTIGFLLLLLQVIVTFVRDVWPGQRHEVDHD
jgi:TRAP-type mannitol/chloroaromatic compound transport system permease small subunit